MKAKKIAGILFVIGLIVFGGYFLYLALPYLIVLSANILYLVGLIIFIIVAIIAILKTIKWFFK